MPKREEKDLLELAIRIAVEGHAGQVDKGGSPYVLHPLAVMYRVKNHGIVAMQVAVLHDIVEDTYHDLEGLRDLGFSDEVIEALDALTQRSGETRAEAAHRAGANPLARIVKLADNAENSDLSRIPSPTAKDHQRVVEYQRVRDILLSYLNTEQV